MMFENLRLSIAEFIAPEIVADRRRLERAANIDPLTGLANRRAFDLARASAESDVKTAVVLFDMNNFGQVNKKCGHSTGDVLLKQAAAGIREAADEYGLGERVFRYGGDEFVVLCPSRIAGTLRDHAEQFVGTTVFGDLEISISGAVGWNLNDADSQIQARKKERKSK